MKYKQLTAADRGVIEGLLQAEYTQEAMAKMLGVDPATVSREIREGSTPTGYQAKTTQLDYERKRVSCRKKKKLQSPQRQKYLVRKLQLGWSPE